MCTVIILPPLFYWLYDHGLLPSIPRNPGHILIGGWFPTAFPLYAEYIENPIWQLHGVHGEGFWFRSYLFSCEFDTREKVLLKNRDTWITGNGANVPQDAEELLPPNLFQAIKNPAYEYWYKDKFPNETTMLIHKKSSERYYLFTMGASD